MKFLTFLLFMCISANAQIFNSASQTLESQNIVTPESWVTVYGEGLKCSAKIKDSANLEKPLFVSYCGNNQVNLFIPVVTLGKAVISIGQEIEVEVKSVNVGIFTFNGNGQGLPVAIALRVRNGTPYYEIIAGYNVEEKAWKPIPIKWNTGADRVFLVLYATGLRHRASLADISVTIGGVSCNVSFGGATNQAGVDQLNVEIPRILENRGKVTVSVSVARSVANETFIVIED